MVGHLLSFLSLTGRQGCPSQRLQYPCLWNPIQDPYRCCPTSLPEKRHMYSGVESRPTCSFHPLLLLILCRGLGISAYASGHASFLWLYSVPAPNLLLYASPCSICGQTAFQTAPLMKSKLSTRLQQLFPNPVVYFTVPHKLQLEYGILMGKYGYSSQSMAGLRK